MDESGTNGNLVRNALPLIASIFAFGYAFYGIEDIKVHVYQEGDYDDFFTLVVPSYEKRKKLLIGLLDYINKDVPYNLLEVVVVWNSVSNVFNKPSKYNFPIRLYSPDSKSVVSRFKPEIRTGCFLSHDDDLRMPAKILDRGFNIWKSNKEQIVGYTKRSYTYVNNSAQYLIHSNSTYSMVLTGMAFLHKRFASEFYTDKYIKSLEYVKSKNNCEDIMMNFVVTDISHKPPIYLKYYYSHISRGGISTKPGHLHARGRCLDEFEKNFGFSLIKTKEILV